jgi:predicted component of type VI protein secretion system
MHRNEGHDCYPTLEQFKHFQREVAGQMEHLKNIMEIQHKQIDLLTSNRQQNSREITEAVLKNEEIE